MADIQQHYLDDFQPGQSFSAGPALMTEEEIISYGKKFDPQVLHTDPEGAKDNFFNGLIASGWHTASVTMSLILQAVPPVMGGVIGFGCDRLIWPRPVRPGDSLSVTVDVIEVRPSKSNPLRGILKVKITTTNQDDLVVQKMESAMTLPRRSGGE